MQLGKRLTFCLILAVVWVLCSGLCAQSRDQREATVGMRAYVEQLVLEGPELVPAPGTTKSPLVVRVIKTWPHGQHLRYDLEWVGFEEGSFDLTKFLVRKDGTSMDQLPAVEVRVLSVLPPGDFEPSDIEPSESRRLDGYSALQALMGALWGAGLLAILFVGRKWQKKPPPAPPQPTLADRLRPLVEEVAGGHADDARKAELERLLVAFWRVRLGLEDARAVDAIMAIRQHEEAGRLLRQVEAWLHAPEPPRELDIAGLLAPYRDVTADSLTVESDS